VGIQFLLAAALPAVKRRLPLQAHLSVGSLAVVGRERLEEAIASRLVGGLVFGEATRASAGVIYRILSPVLMTVQATASAHSRGDRPALVRVHGRYWPVTVSFSAIITEKATVTLR